MPKIKWNANTYSVIFVILFIIIAFINLDILSGMMNAAFAFGIKYLGAYWQILLYLTPIIALLIVFQPGSKRKLGSLEKPEFSTFSWVAMIIPTLMAGGGVFWSAGEPLAHFFSPPPFFQQMGIVGGTVAASYTAVAQSFLHWGTISWAINGALTVPILMYYHYEKGLPLAPRTLLYPLLKEKALGKFGDFIDFFCVIAIVAGTVGPIGFLGLQVGYGLNTLFPAIPNSFGTHIVVIAGLMILYTLSTLAGLDKGIKRLSHFNVILTFFLALYILVAGPTGFIFDHFIEGTGVYLAKFTEMSLFRQDAGWLGGWTLFFWGWFLGYGPLLAIFIARVSRGRTIREIILVLLVTAPVIMSFWFTILGGTGISLELSNPGSVKAAFDSGGGFNLPASLMAITMQLPLGFVVSLLFLLLSAVFVATTADSMTYTISHVVGGGEPTKLMKLFWALVMGVMALILINIGGSGGGIGALQSFIVVSAIPVGFILLPSLWDTWKLVSAFEKDKKLEK